MHCVPTPLSQPLELQWGAQVCSKCLWEWIAAYDAMNRPCCSRGWIVLCCSRWSHVAQKMVPCCSEDDPLLLRGWSPAAQRMVPCCPEDDQLLLRGWSPAAQRMVPCCSEDGPLLLRGWPPAAQRMIPCCSEDDPLLLRG